MKFSKTLILTTSAVSALPRRALFWDNILADLENVEDPNQFFDLPLIEDNQNVLNFGSEDKHNIQIPSRPILSNNFGGNSAFPGRPILSAPKNPKCIAPTHVSPCRLFTNKRKYTFNQQTGQCDSYIHVNDSFCLPNTINTFDSKWECETICEVNSKGPIPVTIPKSGFNFSRFNRPNPFNNNKRRGNRKSSNTSTTKCNAQKSTTGFCRALFSSGWTFDKESNSCEKFVKGGCDNLTANYFNSENECKNSCL